MFMIQKQCQEYVIAVHIFGIVLTSEVNVTQITFRSMPDCERTFDVFDVCGSTKERQRWRDIECVADASLVTCIVFVVSLSCYDKVLWDNEHVNAMSDTLDLWEHVVNDRRFKDSAILLVLNKSDLFEQKIIQKETSITVCPEFANYYGDQQSVADIIEYISTVFLRRMRLGYEFRSHLPRYKRVVPQR
eukprot:20044_1